MAESYEELSQELRRLCWRALGLLGWDWRCADLAGQDRGRLVGPWWGHFIARLAELRETSLPGLPGASLEDALACVRRVDSIASTLVQAELRVVRRQTYAFRGIPSVELLAVAWLAGHRAAFNWDPARSSWPSWLRQNVRWRLVEHVRALRDDFARPQAALSDHHQIKGAPTDDERRSAAELGWPRSRLWAARRPLRALRLEQPSSTSGAPLMARIADRKPTAERLLMSWAKQRRLAKALGKLPPRQREVLRCLFEEGLTVTATARRMGLGRGTVHRERRLALRALRESLWHVAEESP
jgi:RNA polymerase sigma factor (sigma-70 family)